MNPLFASLVLGLAHQAREAIDGQVPPGAGEPRELARALIDTLAMLEEKTAGHLADGEKQLLTEALTGLRLEFVRRHGAG